MTKLKPSRLWAVVFNCLVMFIFFHLCLKFLIKRNYRLRRESALNGDNKYPDEWYWADLLAVKHGYFVKTH